MVSVSLHRSGYFFPHILGTVAAKSWLFISHNLEHLLPVLGNPNGMGEFHS
jgi:hypothetical protein